VVGHFCRKAGAAGADLVRREGSRILPGHVFRYARVMARVPSLRASDSEREEVAERLRHATVEGRLTAGELEERLEALYRSRTYGELDALVADLPVERRPEHRPDRVDKSQFPKWAGAFAAVALLFGVLETLAAAARQSALAAAAAAQARQSGYPPPFVEHQHYFMRAASVLGVMVVLGVCAVVLWAVLQSRTSSDA
jgi:hypothetical protein